MMSLARLGVASAIVLLSYQVTFSQESGFSVPKIEDLVKIPQSPEAQAFAKYGNTSVNLYTGSPEISIPIANLRGREVSVPITLTYDASGIKVEQIATWAGLGWNLSAGGMISRQTRGNPDDYLSATPGYIPFYDTQISNDYNFVNGFTATELTTYPPGQLEQYFHFLERSLKTESDKIEIQPDVYSLGGMGISGTVYIDYSTSMAYCMEHPELKITPIFSVTSTTKVIEEWRVVDAAGNTLFYGYPETTYVNENNSIDGQKTYYSGWVLYKYESFNKRDVVEFLYGQETWAQPQVAGSADYREDVVVHNTACGGDQLFTPASSSPTYTITQSTINGIIINGRTMATMSAGAYRLDLEGRTRLNEIILFDGDGNQLTKWKFLQSYFGPQGGTEKELRLRLDGLEMYGDATSTIPQKYSFIYSSVELPSRESKAQDYWGYFNGVMTNASLIPYNYDYDKANSTYYGWVGGKRLPNEDFVQAATLTSITYPTGGKTEFTYQTHKSAEVATFFKEYIYIGGGGCGGGTQATNPFNYCDDMIPTPPYPKGQESAFNVNQSGSYDIIMTLGGTSGAQGSLMQYFGLYRTGPVNCDENGNCDYGTSLDFCQLFNSTIEKSFYGGLPAPYSFVFNDVYLTAGAYRLLTLSNDPNAIFDVQVWGAPEIESHLAGGLRVSKIVDKDEYGVSASTRYVYYGDLSTVQASNITNQFLESSDVLSGTLHDPSSFEDVKVIEKFDFTQTNPQQITCYSATRFASSRAQSDFHVTYPLVTEVQFDPLSGKTNGYTVYEFSQPTTNQYGSGYSKGTILSGKLSKKRVYDQAGTLLTLEQTYHSQRSVANGGSLGFFFSPQGRSNQDMYVKAPLDNPQNQFFEYKYTTLSGIGQESSEQHCWDPGNNMSIFSDAGLHSFGNDHSPQSSCTGVFVSTHPAVVYFNSLNQAGKTIVHQGLSGTVTVSYPAYQIVYCHDYGGKVNKVPYLFPRSWAVVDSTKTIQYSSTGAVQSVTKNYYENTSHFQITRVESYDSKGVLHTVKQSYPHELSVLEPSVTIWTDLINQHRIGEVIKQEASYGSNQPDFVHVTRFKTVSTTSGNMIVRDKEQFSSGSGALEDRIFYYGYDQAGNPIEVSRANDMRQSYCWDATKAVPVAVARNASSNEIFFTSFENEEGANSTDAHAGAQCRTGGYSKALTGLTPNKPYVLTYWQKSGGVWSLQTTNISASSATTYNISITGQVDDVRFYPAGSQMTTYTHKLGTGMTSATDLNNLTTYYEYDPLGRLIIVRDNDGKILKRFEYHLLGDAINQY